MSLYFMVFCNTISELHHSPGPHGEHLSPGASHTSATQNEKQRNLLINQLKSKNESILKNGTISSSFRNLVQKMSRILFLNLSLLLSVTLGYEVNDHSPFGVISQREGNVTLHSREWTHSFTINLDEATHANLTAFKIYTSGQCSDVFHPTEADMKTYCHRYNSKMSEYLQYTVIWKDRLYLSRINWLMI